MISALRALWAAAVAVVCRCVCMCVCFCGCVRGCLEQAWGRFWGQHVVVYRGLPPKPWRLLNFYGESSTVQTSQCRPTHCTSQAHSCQTHTHISSSSQAFIRGATSSQACSLTLQSTPPSLSRSVTPLHSGPKSFFWTWAWDFGRCFLPASLYDFLYYLCHDIAIFFFLFILRFFCHMDSSLC